MMRNRVFMKLVEGERQRRSWTVKYLCDEYDIDRKEYDWYLKDIKTPSPDFVLKMIRAFGLDAFM